MSTRRSSSAHSSTQRAPRQRRAAIALSNHRFQFAALVGRHLHPVHAFQDGATQLISMIQWTSGRIRELRLLVTAKQTCERLGEANLRCSLQASTRVVGGARRRSHRTSRAAPRSALKQVTLAQVFAEGAERPPGPVPVHPGSRNAWPRRVRSALSPAPNRAHAASSCRSSRMASSAVRPQR